jgi:hypothetical protein
MMKPSQPRTNAGTGTLQRNYLQQSSNSHKRGEEIQISLISRVERGLIRADLAGS